MMTDTEKKLTIDANDVKSLQEAIREGITTPELLADWLDDAELDGDVLVLQLGTWHADDGNCELTFECDTGEEAATRYVKGGDWGVTNSTTWVNVSAWQTGIDADGDLVRMYEEWHKVTIDPKEPDCYNNEDHEWESPYELLGGLEENPGVWGHGGGAWCETVCLRCGCRRQTDSWAQDSEDGEQGLYSVTYEEDYYTDRLSEIAAKEGRRLGTKIADDNIADDEAPAWPGIPEGAEVNELVQGKFREELDDIAEDAYYEALREAGATVSEDDED